MAISIDTVYQKVLTLANKEQRGYITPQEFNIFADQVQLEIFEQYFYDLNQIMRVQGNNEEYSDITHNINEKIAIFESVSDTTGTGSTRVINAAVIGQMWRLGTVFNETTGTELEQVQQDEILYLQKSSLIAPSGMYPVYVRTLEDTISVFPTGMSGTFKCNYIRKPDKPSWGYVVINSRAMYDSANTVDFELHPAEQNEVIYKILKLAGVSIKRDDLVKTGQGLESLQVQQEKL